MNTKKEWIDDFREKGNDILMNLSVQKSYKIRAAQINKEMKAHRDSKVKVITRIAQAEGWEKQALLNEILLITYASYIAMLEYRNKIWEYEYMSFARRIGELWESFCKLVFEFSLKPLTMLEPPKFDDIQMQIKQRTFDYIHQLDLDEETKKTLVVHYHIPWNIITSGVVRLNLDLHFEQSHAQYNCDFKSGFSSNEKGNTNRLLLVASIYDSLNSYEKTILFVRQREDENNHYLMKLKNSSYWQVYCADDTYLKIKEFTGFDVRKWLDVNVDWGNDISYEFKAHLQKLDLLKYLTW